MAYTHFQQNLLPSPFVVIDQIITGLTYGRFFNPPSTLLNIFLVPLTYWGSSGAYMLGFLYSYIALHYSAPRILYLWVDDNINKPCSSHSGGVQYILGKEILYEGDILAEFSDEIEYVSDLGMDNENWSIHMSYLSMIEATVIPLYVPISWLNEYHEKLEQLIVKATNQGILIIGMDEFYVEKKQDYYHMIPKQSADHRFCSLMSSMAIVRDQNLSFLTFQEVDNKKKYATIAGLLL